MCGEAASHLRAQTLPVHSSVRPIFVISQVLDEINMETTVPSSVLEGIKLKTVFLLLLLLFCFFLMLRQVCLVTHRNNQQQ